MEPTAFLRFPIYLFLTYWILKRMFRENIATNPIYALISYQLILKKPTMNIEIIDKKLAHCIKIIPNSDVKISLHVS